MESSLKLQMDVKNNAEEFLSYMLDLNNWEEEMKRKEKELNNASSKIVDLPPPRNKIKRNSSEKLSESQKFSEEEKKVKRINAYDYSAWDKYDADKACAELDEESDGEQAKEKQLTKEEKEETKREEQVQAELGQETKSLKNIDEAFYEKELGNLFVKKEKWEDAIKCYTKAINLDSKNAIYYANRALCFIKLKNFKSAEVDATVAIQIDSTYVKAYQRRAVARKALGQHKEAILDYQEILKLEPKNSFANVEISKLENLIKSELKNGDKKTGKPTFDPRIIFKNEPKKVIKEVVKKKKENTESAVEKKVEDKDEIELISGGSPAEKIVTDGKNHEVNKSRIKNSNEDLDDLSIFGKVPEGFTVIKPIHVPPHLRSNDPLRTVPIREAHTDEEDLEDFINLKKNFKSDGQKIASEKEKEVHKEIPKIIQEKPKNPENLNFPAPVTCVQFIQAWKCIKHDVQSSYSYLKKINAEKLPNIFRHSLESDLFSELISTLAEDDLSADYNLIYSFLYHLSKVQRFGSLVLFMSSSDKENLNKCIARLKENKSREEIEELYNLYELSNKM